MAKHRSRKQKGGSAPASAWGYMYNTVGNGWTQFQNALTMQPGDNLVSQQSNNIEPVGNPNFGNAAYDPSKTNLTLIQSAGKRRNKRNKKSKSKSRSSSRSRSRKGGYWGEVASQAIVPLTLLGLQNRVGKRKTQRRRR
jgi:hypothetical protein